MENVKISKIDCTLFVFATAGKICRLIESPTANFKESRIHLSTYVISQNLGRNSTFEEGLFRMYECCGLLGPNRFPSMAKACHSLGFSV